MKITRKIVSVTPLHVIVTYTDDNGDAIEFDSSKYSPEVIAELLTYGAGRFPSDRTSASDRSSKLADMQAVLDDLSNGVISKRASGSSVADKLEKAKAQLVAFHNQPKEVQLALEAMSMGKAFLEDNIKRAEKNLAKFLEKKSQ